MPPARPERRGEGGTARPRADGRDLHSPPLDGPWMGAASPTRARRLRDLRAARRRDRAARGGRVRSRVTMCWRSSPKGSGCTWPSQRRESIAMALGNAILSRWPIGGVSMLDLLAPRAARRGTASSPSTAASTWWRPIWRSAIRTRHRQVRSLLDHPNLRTNPTLLLGDMNAWRRCKATRALEGELRQHHNLDWPASFPAASSVSRSIGSTRAARASSLYATQPRRQAGVGPPADHGARGGLK